MADFPAAAVDRLRKYNGERYNAQTNPFGLAIGGHRQNYPPSLNETASVAAYIAAAAGEIGQAAEQTADDRRQTGLDREAARQSAAAAATFDPALFLRKAVAKLDPEGSLFKGPSAGTSNPGIRTVQNLASYRATGDAQGAIVFLSPAGVDARQIMHRLRVEGFLYNPARSIDTTVNGYLFDPTLVGGTGSPSFALTASVVTGSVAPLVRWARSSNGRTALILGDVGTVWSFPAIAITTAVLSASVTDAYCTGWTSELVSDLSSYTTITTAPATESLPTKLNNASGAVSNANLVNMPANTVKGRLSTAGAQTDLTFAALLAAFGTFINGSSNGYAKIPLTDTNGVIINFYLQWGLASGTGDVQLSFPMEFPNAVFAFASTADAQNIVPNATTAYSDFVRSLTRAGMVVCKRAITGSGPNTHNLLSRWIALGY